VKPLHILYLDPYHAGSHAATATSYAARSRHNITLLSLPIAGGWRWRMRGAAVTFARMVREQGYVPDLIFTTDMLDLATFRALTSDIYPAHIPAVCYFFENQLTYPLPAGRSRDLSFAWTNVTSALVAHRVLFNSAFHRRWFFDALPGFLGRYHDYNELHIIEEIAAKAEVLPTGIDLQRLDVDDSEMSNVRRGPEDEPPVIAWISRWDYDKQPQVFFDALETLAARGVAFRLIVAGEHVDPNAPEFVAARERWAAHIIHWGYPADTATYRRLLHQADVVVSTAVQETLGIGVIEALFCGCIPILPRRLVYPSLLPEAYHADCLYDDDALLADTLHRALLRCDELRRRDWRAIAVPYDWSCMAPAFDMALGAAKAHQKRP
jgi:glycosyltransferase involved in cell wall biosynthesis